MFEYDENIDVWTVQMNGLVLLCHLVFYTTLYRSLPLKLYSVYSFACLCCKNVDRNFSWALLQALVCQTKPVIISLTVQHD